MTHFTTRAGMDRARLDRVIQHYERVSRQALRTLPALADRCTAESFGAETP